MKGKLVTLPTQKNEKILLYDNKGQPLLVQIQRPIGFQMDRR